MKTHPIIIAILWFIAGLLWGMAGISKPDLNRDGHVTIEDVSIVSANVERDDTPDSFYSKSNSESNNTRNWFFLDENGVEHDLRPCLAGDR